MQNQGAFTVEKLGELQCLDRDCAGVVVNYLEEQEQAMVQTFCPYEIQKAIEGVFLAMENVEESLGFCVRAGNVGLFSLVMRHSLSSTRFTLGFRVGEIVKKVIKYDRVNIMRCWLQDSLRFDGKCLAMGEAISSGKMEMVRLLLREPDMQGDKTQYKLCLAKDALSKAYEGGHVEMVKFWLQDALFPYVEKSGLHLGFVFSAAQKKGDMGVTKLILQKRPDWKG